MPKPIVFISHITEEKEFAEAVKMLIKKSYLGAVEIFVSSDQDSIEAGSKWLNKVNDALKDCIIELVLCSEISVKRSWINFEAGAGWVRDIPTIPVCHSGMQKGSLPVPLNSLQAVNLNDKDDINRILSVISKSLEMDIPTPDLDGFINEIKQKELAYTTGRDMREFFDAMGGYDETIRRLKRQTFDNVLFAYPEKKTNEFYQNLMKHITPSIRKYIEVKTSNPGISFNYNGIAQNDVVIQIMLKNREEILRLCGVY